MLFIELGGDVGQSEVGEIDGCLAGPLGLTVDFADS